jgi:hypothetical protein
LLLGLGVAYYLPTQEAYLRARYFRVMGCIGENIQNRTKDRFTAGGWTPYGAKFSMASVSDSFPAVAGSQATVRNWLCTLKWQIHRGKSDSANACSPFLRRLRS